MEKIMINIKGWNLKINERFKDKDLISLQDLLDDYEDLIDENEDLQEELNDLKTFKEEDFDEDRADDYRHGLL